MRATSSAALSGSCHRATDTSITASARRQSAHTAWRAAQSRLSAVVAPIRFGSKRKSWGGCADVAGGDCPTARSGGRDADAGATAPMQSLPLSYPPSPRSVETVNTRHRWAGSDPDAHYTALRRGSQGARDAGWRLKPRLEGAHAPRSLPPEAGFGIGTVPDNEALPHNNPSPRRRASWPAGPSGAASASPPLAHKPCARR